MTPQTKARATIKAINRHLKRNYAFEGGRQYGIDYATWRVSYPKLSAAYQAAAEILTGRPGRFVPRF